MFITSKEELFEIPRIAILYSDPDWADFIDPVKTAFEIPPSFFKNIHVDDIESEFFSKKAQYLLCILCPNTVTYAGIDFGKNVHQWYEFLEQGAFLFVFGTDVDWLSNLGGNFQIRGRNDDSVTIKKFLYDEADVLKNCLFIEGLEALDPWLGEYVNVSPAWTALTESNNGYPTLVVQNFGNSHIVCCSAGLEKTNMKKIFPVRLLMWGLKDTILDNKADSIVDYTHGWAGSVELHSNHVSKESPCKVKVCLNRFDQDEFPPFTLKVMYHVRKKGEKIPVTSKEVIEDVAAGKMGLLTESIIEVKEFEDGDYEVVVELACNEVKSKITLDFKVITRELDQITECLMKIEKKSSTKLEELKKMFSVTGYKDSRETGKKIELMRRLLLLQNRIQQSFEIVDNILRRNSSTARLKEPGLAVAHDNIRNLRTFYDEIVAKASCLFENIRDLDANFGSTRNQQKNLLIQRVISSLEIEAIWEVRLYPKLKGFFSTGGTKRGDDVISLLQNGFPVLGATIVLRSKKDLAKVLKNIEKPGSNFTRYENTFLAENDARFFLMKGNDRRRGTLVHGDMIVTLNSTSVEGMLLFCEKFIQNLALVPDDMQRMIDTDELVIFEFPEECSSFADTLLQPFKGGKTSGLNNTGNEPAMHFKNVPGNDVRFLVDPARLNILRVEIGSDSGFSVEDCLEALHEFEQVELGQIDYFFADVHSHSTASDGFYKPVDCGISAACAGIDIFGLTDHHTIGPSNWLHDYGKHHGWQFSILPGCQEVTFIHLHAVSVGAKATVNEMVPVENIIEEARSVGSPLIYAHARLPHPWPAEQLKLGSKSGFLAYEYRDDSMQKYKVFWDESGQEPIWTSSSGSDAVVFGGFGHTLVFIRKTKEAESRLFPTTAEFLQAIRENNCIPGSGLGYSKKSSDKLLVRFLIREDGTIASSYKERNLKKFASLR
ncbi:MAG: PHP domain-containing protein [Candidatus Hodarchaeota archaeon]